MQKNRLLIIDDELGPRESLRFLFKDSYEVVCAESVDQGVAELRRNPPEVIIMDIRMPGKNGIQGLRELRAIDPMISIVMLTGFGSLETAQEAIRLGATDYIKKPFDTSEIRTAVAGYASRTCVQRKRIAAIGRLEELTAQLRKQLDTAKEMASFGTKSSELVHDLSNPLTAINGLVQMLIQDIRDKKVPEKGLSLDFLAKIDRSSTRCQEILTLWRDRARRAESSIKRIQLAPLIAEVADNARALAAAKSVRITLLPGPEDCVIEGDNIQLFRAIQNIVGNAIEAVPETHGCVTIQCRGDGRGILVEVEDNGCGFPPDKIGDLKTRCQTTKSETGGMGLGLFITKNIVEAHGGSLLLANNASGKGARVSLLFPRPG